MTVRGHAIVIAAFALLGFSFALADEKGGYVLRDSNWVKVAPPAVGTSAGELSLVRSYLNDGKPGKALDAADKFLGRYSDAPEREEVMMLAGQAEMARGHYFQAYERFESQLAAFPGGEFFSKAIDQEFQVAEFFLQGKKKLVMKVLWIPARDDGLDILRRIAEHVPGTDIAQKALLRVADDCYSRLEYMDAVQAYDNYLKLFPKAGKSGYATLQAARAVLDSYRGPSFDETPLIDAEQRFRLVGENFPDLADKANVAVVLDHIRELRAQKMCVTAEFYERTHKPQTAAYYYKQVLEDYPQTRWASDARKSLDRLGVKVELRKQPVGAGAATRPADGETAGQGGAGGK